MPIICGSPANGSKIIEYNLGRNYTQFEATIGMTDRTYSGASGQVEFLVDNQLIPDASRQLKVGSPFRVVASVKDALRLTIVVTDLYAGCSSDDQGLALGTPILTR